MKDDFWQGYLWAGIVARGLRNQFPEASVYIDAVNAKEVSSYTVSIFLPAVQAGCEVAQEMGFERMNTGSYPCSFINDRNIVLQVWGESKVDPDICECGNRMVKFVGLDGHSYHRCLQCQPNRRDDDAPEDIPL